MLRSFTILDLVLVSLIRKNPKYTKMVIDEVLGKFVGHQMMVKDDKYIDDIANMRNTSIEPQVIAFKATNDKEALPSKVMLVEVVGLNDVEMALVIYRVERAQKLQQQAKEGRLLQVR